MSPRLVHAVAGSGLEISVTGRSDARDKLVPHICGECLDDLMIEDADGRRVVAGLDDLLATGCGLEWTYYDGAGGMVFLGGEMDLDDSPEVESSGRP